MALKVYDLGREIINIKDSPNLTFEFREGRWDMYQNQLLICHHDKVIAQITGNNPGDVMAAIISGATKRHRRLIRQYLDYVDAGQPDDFKWEMM